MDIEPESIVPSSNISSRPRSLFWDGEKSLKYSESGLSYIQLQDRTLNILKVLSDRAKVNFQFLLQGNAHGEELAPITIKRKGEHAQHHKEVRLSVTLYGPRDTAGDVGVWLGKCNLYLQMPENCDRNVPYCNPHCLSFNDDDQLTTFELFAESADSVTAGKFESTQFLAGLDNEECLEEAPQPSNIETTLHK